MRMWRLVSEPPASGRVTAAPRASASLAVVLLLGPLLGLAVAGCVDGPGAQPWAASVCEALAPWRDEIGALTERAQEQMAAATTPAQAQENLVRLFDGARQASEDARARVVAAGVPQVDGGPEVAAEVSASLAATGDAYGRAGDTIAALPTGDPELFYQGVAEALATLRSEYADSALDTTELESPELVRAFDEVPQCH